MNWHLWNRQCHRWLSIIFTVTVVANFVVRAVAPGEPPLVADLLAATTAVSAVVYRAVPIRAALCHKVACKPHA